MTAPAKTTASFTRARSPFGLGVTTQSNSQLFAAARKGADLRLVWAAPGSNDGGVAEYRAEGYKVVNPRDVEEMIGGQYEPSEKDIGVYVEVDRKADRITGRGGMVLMVTTGANYRARQVEQAEMSDMWYRKSRKAEVDARGTELTISETVTHENLADIL